MATTKFLAILVFICANAVADAAEPSVVDCPEYVLEGEDLTCACVAVDCTGQVTLTWPGQSTTDRLELTNVARSQNGTEFTCQMNCDGQTSTVKYTLKVYYPPTEPPKISGYTGQLLKHGDVMSCSVRGGYPLVSAVIFYCIDPKIEDVPDDVGDTSVTSVLTVNTTGATAKNMTCFCTANWSPIFAKYQLQDTVVTQTEYKATLDEFHFNGTSGVVTMSEGDKNVIIYIAGTGRPAPEMSVRWRTGGNMQIMDRSNNGTWTKTETLAMETVTCWAMGQYNGSADNGFPDPVEATIQLNVLCAPRVLDKTNSAYDIEPNTKVSPSELNRRLLLYYMLAHPLPDTITVTFYGKENANSGRVIDSYSDMFTIDARRVRDEAVVMVTITPKNIPAEYEGVFGVNTTNYLGSAMFYFQVIMKIPPEMKEFSINHTAVALTVHEKEAVHFLCRASGRPEPTLTLAFRSDTSQERVLAAVTTYSTWDMTTMTLIIHSVMAGDMGSYRCTADNQHFAPVAESIQLSVNCPPRYPSTSQSVATASSPLIPDTDGLTFILVAYPTPQIFRFTFHDVNTSEAVPDGVFTVTLTRVSTSASLNCVLKSAGVDDKYLTDTGMFSVDIQNAFGSVRYNFQVRKEEDADSQESKANIGGIIGGVTAAAVAIFVVIIAVCVVNRRKRKESQAYSKASCATVTGYSRSYDNVVRNSEMVEAGYESIPSVPKNITQTAEDPPMKTPVPVLPAQTVSEKQPLMDTGKGRDGTTKEQMHDIKGEQPLTSKGEQPQDAAGEQSGETKGDQPFENKTELSPDSKPTRPETATKAAPGNTQPPSEKPVGYVAAVGAKPVPDPDLPTPAQPITAANAAPQTADVKEGPKEGKAAAGPFKTTISTGPVKPPASSVAN